MAKKKIPPLTVEYKQDQTTLHYLSLLEYRRENFLVVIDNITDTEITAFTLDFIKEDVISLTNFLSICNVWFYKSSGRYPLSFEIAKLGLSKKLAPLIKTFDVNNVSRIVGIPFEYKIEAKPKIKRRRVIPVQEGVQIVLKKLKEISANS